MHQVSITFPGEVQNLTETAMKDLSRSPLNVANYHMNLIEAVNNKRKQSHAVVNNNLALTYDPIKFDCFACLQFF